MRDYITNGLNQYESAGTVNFCYDANGNLTADGTKVYLYDIDTLQEIAADAKGRRADQVWACERIIEQELVQSGLFEGGGGGSGRDVGCGKF